ncbi:uncharacterized protein LOC142329108 [Lycorma delicatula]|uniref:uncharacterized protein LOC142329108 n=1 Tax=Lycorma delicatula TaxID=130591 RepID=UPI003F5146AF
MPHRRHRGPPKDPLTACLDADGTYICTAYNSRCYIIQKVTPSPTVASLNPDADVFQSKVKPGSDASGSSSGWETLETDVSLPDGDSCGGYVYMNGDVGKLPSGAVFSATPEPLATPQTASAQPATTNTITDFSVLNGVVESPLEGYSDVPGGSASELPPAPEQAPVPVHAPAAAVPSSGLPLDQLKQMLSSQLEYYFSRYLSVLNELYSHIDCFVASKYNSM